MYNLIDNYIKLIFIESIELKTTDIIIYPFKIDFFSSYTLIIEDTVNIYYKINDYLYKYYSFPGEVGYNIIRHIKRKYRNNRNNFKFNNQIYYINIKIIKLNKKEILKINFY